ncbi:hypothetical protein ZYGR_0U01100 [Zygosaccharomyces rouxii]|uniref:Uncharacterized protein n=1 Tax=Zygosaccharomyces rouxii TaxID=4956 RepID=A0A1Q3A3G1_ZYGRO|nr:hypothetical protein ZYGR_0U01100 [Zygosaccharomyces rouxii]
MSQLIEVYNCIDGAENKTRKGDLSESLSSYKHAIELLNGLECQGVSLEIIHAIQLLRQDIDARTKELESLIEGQKPISAAAVAAAVAKNGSLASSTGSTAKTRGWDSPRNLNSPAMGPGDPLLASIFGKLQANLVNSICEQFKEEDPHIVGEVENRVRQQLVRFKKELGLYEQKKSKDYSVRFEQAINENKKLSNQILKLRGRWDSLVESAKQRRSRQHED